MKNPFTWLKNWWLVDVPLAINQELRMEEDTKPKPAWWIEYHSKPIRFHIRHQEGQIVATAYLTDYENKAAYEVALGLARFLIYDANIRAKELPLLPTYINKKGKKP